MYILIKKLNVILFSYSHIICLQKNYMLKIDTILDNTFIFAKSTKKIKVKDIKKN